MKANRFELRDIMFFPLSLLYGFVVGFRNFLFNIKVLRSVEFKLPIISVGNISVGGTGKTPHTEYLIKLLKDDYKIATLSRGYKRLTNGFILADNDSNFEQIGDEPAQMKKKFSDIEIAVDGNRVRGVKRLLEERKDTQVVLLDDAYQHRYINPGLNILLIDNNNPIDEDRLLPLGRLRESASELHRANIIIITKCSPNIKPIEQRLLEKRFKQYPYQKIYFTTLSYNEPMPVFEGVKKVNNTLKISENTHVLLITGIANSKPLKSHIQILTPFITELSFPDHYSYSSLDIQYIIEKFELIDNKDKVIITTEKDAMRFQHKADIDDKIKAAMFYIPVEVTFLNGEEKTFNHFILNFVRNNKPDSLLYKKYEKKVSTMV